MLKYGLGRIIDLISTLILRRFQRGVLVGKFVLAWLTTDVSFLPTSHWFIQRYFGTSQQVWDLKYLPHIKEKLNTSKQFQWISLNVPQFVTTPNMIDNYLKVIIFLVNNPYLLHPYIFRTETNSWQMPVISFWVSNGFCPRTSCWKWYPRQISWFAAWKRLKLKYHNLNIFILCIIVNEASFLKSLNSLMFFACMFL